jgi:uncharacterized UPF0160 family protein
VVDGYIYYSEESNDYTEVYRQKLTGDEARQRVAEGRISQLDILPNGQLFYSEQDGDRIVSYFQKNEKPDNKLQRELEILARAEKHMMINAPGFAPAWEMAKSQALSQIETEEKGMSFPQKIFRKLIGPSSSATNVALPESAMNAAKNSTDMTSNAA